MAFSFGGQTFSGSPLGSFGGNPYGGWSGGLSIDRGGGREPSFFGPRGSIGRFGSFAGGRVNPYSGQVAPRGYHWKPGYDIWRNVHTFSIERNPRAAAKARPSRLTAAQKRAIVRRQALKDSVRNFKIGSVRVVSSTPLRFAGNRWTAAENRIAANRNMARLRLVQAQRDYAASRIAARRNPVYHNPRTQVAIRQFARGVAARLAAARRSSAAAWRHAQQVQARRQAANLRRANQIRVNQKLRAAAERGWK